MMIKMTGRLYFKTIAIVLVAAFMSLDVAWAYPAENGAHSCTLAVPSVCQQQPMTPEAARFQQSIFAESGAIGSVGTVAKYLLGDPEDKNSKPLPLEHLEQVLTAELGGALAGIDLSKVMVKDGVVFVPYKKDGKECIIQIALKNNLTMKDLAGYEWVISDKYAVKRLPRDYDMTKAVPAEPAAAESVTTPPAEEPKVTITEPIAEMKAETIEMSEPNVPIRKQNTFTIRAILTTVALFFGIISGSFFPAPANSQTMESTPYASSALSETETYEVELLIKQLKKGPDACIKAAAALGEKRDVRAIKPLIALLGSPLAGLTQRHNEKSVCIAAKEALEEIGEPAVEPLIEAVKSYDNDVKHNAIEALGVIGDERAVEPMKVIILYDRTYTAINIIGRGGPRRPYRAAIIALQSMANGNNEASKALHYAVENVRERDICQELKSALGKSGFTKTLRDKLDAAYQNNDSQKVEELKSALADIDKNALKKWEAEKRNEKTVKVLIIAGERAAILAAVVGLFFACWRILFPVSWYLWRLKRSDYKVSTKASKALQNLGAPAIPGLIKLLKHRNSTIRHRAAEALINIDNRIAAKAFKDNLSDINLSADVRSSAAEALGKMQDFNSINLLIAQLDDKSPSVRAASVTALGEMRDVSAVGAMTTKLGDEDINVRRAIAMALGNINHEAVIPPLVVLLGDKDNTIRYGSASTLMRKKWQPQTEKENVLFNIARHNWAALGKIWKPQAVDALIGAFDTEQNPDIRGNILESLSNINNPKVFPVCIRALTDNHPPVRVQAVRGIGRRIKNNEGTEHLIFALADADWHVRDSAAKLLLSSEDSRIAPLAGYIKYLAEEPHAGYLTGLSSEEAAIILDCMRHGKPYSVRFQTADIVEYTVSPSDPYDASYTVITVRRPNCVFISTEVSIQPEMPQEPALPAPRAARRSIMDARYAPDVLPWDLKVELPERKGASIEPFDFQEMNTILNMRSWMWRYGRSWQYAVHASTKLDFIHSRIPAIVEALVVNKLVASAEDIMSIYLAGSYPWIDMPNDLDLVIIVNGERGFARVTSDNLKLPSEIEPGLKTSFEITGLETLKRAARGEDVEAAQVTRRRLISYYGAIPIAGIDIFKNSQPPLENFETMRQDLITNAELANWPDLKGDTGRIAAKKRWRAIEAGALQDWIGCYVVKAESFQRSVESYGLLGALSFKILRWFRILSIASVVWLAAANLFAGESGAEGQGYAFTALSWLKDFAVEHPAITIPIAVFVGLCISTWICVGVTILIWRIFFPINWQFHRLGIYEARKSAWKTLVNMGMDVVPYLINIIAGRRSNLRQDAMGILKAIKDPRMGEFLIVALKNENANIRAAAAEALGDRKDRRAVRALIKALADSSSSVQYHAITALGKIGDISAIAPLVSLLAGDHKYITAFVLKEMGWRPRDMNHAMLYYLALRDWEALAGLGTAVIPDLLARLKDDNDEKFLAGIAETLGKIRDPIAIEPLIAALESEANRKRFQFYGPFYQAVESALTNIGAPAVPALVDILKNAGRPDIARSVAVRVLGKIKDGRAIEPLIEAYGDEHMRWAVIQALVNIKDPRSAEVLAANLTEGKNSMFKMLGEALAEMGAPAVPHLIKVLTFTESEDRYGNARIAALEILSKIRGSHAIEPVKKLILECQNNHVCLAAVKALDTICGGIKDKELTRPLVQLMACYGDGRVTGILCSIANPDVVKSLGDILNNARIGEGRLSKEQIELVSDCLIQKIPFIVEYVPAETHIQWSGESYDPYGSIISSEVVIDKAAKLFITTAEEVTKQLENIRNTVRMELSGKRAMSAKGLFTCVQSKVPESMVRLRNALKTLEFMSKQKHISADAISKKIAEDKQDFKLSGDEESILWLAMTGPGQGMGQASEGAKRPVAEQIKSGTGTSVTQLFELVESTINNRRARLVEGANEAISFLAEKHKLPAGAQPIDRRGPTVEMISRMRKITARVDALQRRTGAVPAHIISKVGDIRQNLNQLEADSVIASIIILARRAKREGEKLIVGLETSWIPGINERGHGTQHDAINVLLKEIRSVGDILRELGMDNIEIVEGDGGALAGTLLDRADKTKTKLSNVVVLASSATVQSDAFAPLRSTPEEQRAFLGGIDAAELLKYYSENKDMLAQQSRQLEMEIMKMLSIMLELATGKEPPQLPIIVYYDKTLRIVVFLPKVSLMDYERLKDKYEAEEIALRKA